MPNNFRAPLRTMRALGLSILVALACRAKRTATGAATGSGNPVDIDPIPTNSNIHHVVVVVQENHTFDSYFGRYCTAPTGSNPTCTEGPTCCERAPDTDPSGAAPVVLDDNANGIYDPTHEQACELAEIDSGAMDAFVSGASCSDPRNFAIAPDALIAPYFALAGSGALADRYFQPIAGASTSNDMYFAVSKYVFTDDTVYPKNTWGSLCTTGAVFGGATAQQYTSQTTIADLLLGAGLTFAFYAEGFNQAVAASPGCAPPPSDCPLQVAFLPCDYDPSDDPFTYYAQFAQDSVHLKDYSALADDVAAGQLPNVSFVKALTYRNEHPGYLTTISAGITFVDDVVNLIENSDATSADTLILVTWDEGGGFFDHISPPGINAVDEQPYGTRIPLLALGTFARKNTVSHVPMEHSSILRFIEYNFLGAVGQLNGRDAVVNNIGSLLDPSTTGLMIP